MFLVNYDENDGLFDHVAPPLPPAGTPDEFVQVSGSPNWPIGLSWCRSRQPLPVTPLDGPQTLKSSG